METRSKVAEFLNDELKSCYWTEKHLLKSIGTWSIATASESLITALERVVKDGSIRVERLEEMFDALGIRPEASKSEAVQVLLDDVATVLKSTEKEAMLKGCMLMIGVQKTMHYLIASYGSMASLAKMLGEEETAELLAISFKEMKAEDSTWSIVAQYFINEEAYNEEHN